MLNTAPLLRFLCLSLRSANTAAIKQFKHGERVGEVRQSVEHLIVPVLAILQDRVNRASAHNIDVLASDDHSLKLCTDTLEEVRSNWCSLLGDEAMANNVAVSDMLAMVLEPPAAAAPSAQKAMETEQLPSFSKNVNNISQEEDLRLSDDYRAALAKLAEVREGAGGGSQ